MSGRGHLTVPGVMRHGPTPGNGTQIDEINHLVMENKRLVTSIAAMRQDRAMVDEEYVELKLTLELLRRKVIQIRVLLEKIARMELGLKVGESVKKDLQQAHKDAQSLVVTREELTLKIKQASQDLDEWHTDIKRIPELLSKLDSMKLEHQLAFEHEKHMNLDLVEHMQAKEKNLVSMDREVETLRAKILDVEKRVQAPYDGAHPNQDAQYPSLYPSNDLYYDPYRRAAMEGTVSHSNSGEPPAVGAISNSHRHWVAYDPKFESLHSNRD